MTLAVLGLVAVFLILYDLWTGLNNGSESTISWQLYILGVRFPLVPFAFGILMGHIWGGMSGIGCK